MTHYTKTTKHPIICITHNELIKLLIILYLTESHRTWNEFVVVVEDMKEETDLGEDT